MKRHEIDALFGLRSDDLKEKLRLEEGNIVVESRDGFVDGNRSERSRGSFKHPLANGINVIARGEVHNEIGASLKRNGKLGEFIVLIRANRTAAKVSIDFR